MSLVAMYAGLLGALGGSLAKLGFDPSSEIVSNIVSLYCTQNDADCHTGVGLLMHCFFIAASLFMSGWGVATFFAAMDTPKSSSVAITVLSTGSNIVCSGIFALILGETIEGFYVTGSCLIVAGMAVITLAQTSGVSHWTGPDTRKVG